MGLHIFVPRWMNRSVTNAQNSGMRAPFCPTFLCTHAPRWTAVGSEPPVMRSPRNGIEIKSFSSRFWKYQLALAYQSRFDAIFYPGGLVRRTRDETAKAVGKQYTLRSRPSKALLPARRMSPGSRNSQATPSFLSLVWTMRFPESAGSMRRRTTSSQSAHFSSGSCRCL